MRKSLNTVTSKNTLFVIVNVNHDVIATDDDGDFTGLSLTAPVWMFRTEAEANAALVAAFSDSPAFDMEVLDAALVRVILERRETSAE